MPFGAPSRFYAVAALVVMDPQVKEALVNPETLGWGDKTFTYKFKTRLYEGLFRYQKYGFRYIYERVRDGKGTLLADYMGLGKTMQAIAVMDEFLQDAAEGDIPRRCLVIAPASVVENWRNEINVTAGSKDESVEARFRATTLAEVDTRSEYVKEWYDKGGVVIVSYESLDSLLKTNVTLRGQLLKAGLVVADESHRARKADGELYKMMTRFACPKVLLTGFPIQNQMEEFRNLLSLVDPDFAAMTPAFVRYAFQLPIDKDEGLRDYRAYTLNRLAQAAMVRRGPLVSKANQDFGRMKDMTWDEFQAAGPGRMDYLVLCRLNDLQERLYKDYMDHRSSRAASEKTEDEGVLMSNQFAIRLGVDPQGLLEDLRAEHKIDEAATASNSGMSAWAYRRTLKPPPDTNMDARETNPDKMLTQEINGDIVIVSSPWEPVGGVIERNGDEPGRLLRIVHPLDEAYEYLVEAVMEGQEIEAPAPPSSLPWFKDDYTDNNEGVAKLDICASIVDSAWEENEKSLVFSQSMATLDKIEKKMVDQGYEIYRVDGSTPQSKRQGIVNDFSDLENKCVFIASTMAAGEGLNIQCATRVILMDSCWNPCPDEQVICRSYRYGQKKRVQVYRLMGCGTLEELVLQRQFEKSRLASLIVDGTRKSALDFWRVEKYHGTKFVNQPIKLNMDDASRELFDSVPDSYVKSVIPLQITEDEWTKDDAFKAEAETLYKAYVSKVNILRAAEKRAKKPNARSPELRAFVDLYK